MDVQPRHELKIFVKKTGIVSQDFLQRTNEELPPSRYPSIVDQVQWQTKVRHFSNFRGRLSIIVVASLRELMTQVL